MVRMREIHGYLLNAAHTADCRHAGLSGIHLREGFRTSRNDKSNRLWKDSGHGGHFRCRNDNIGRIVLLAVIVLCAAFLSACGNDAANNAASGSGEPGGISFSLAWPDSLGPENGASEDRGVSRAPTGDVCVDWKISTINVNVYSTGNVLLKTEPFTCSAHTGFIKIDQGSYKIDIEGKTAGGTVDWRGQKASVTVTSGAVAEAGKVAMTYIGTDIARPTVVSNTPASGAVNVAVNTPVSANFSEVMAACTIDTSTFTLKRGDVAVTGTVSYNEAAKAAEFTPLSSLSAGTTYTATITTGVKDLAGNAIVSNYLWSFTTGAAPDTTPPTVSSTSPANNATNVAVNSAISVTFSEAMNAATITASMFSIAGVSGAVSVNGSTATFTPSANLAFSTTYVATVATGVKDAAGNAMSANYSWSFTTGTAPDTTPPTVSSTSPANNATNVAVNSAISVIFSETMNAATISTSTFGIAGVSGAVSVNGSTATLTPSANLAYSTTYVATVTTGVKDAAGNAMSANYSWTFTTGTAPDTTPPTIPANLAAVAASSSGIDLAWSASTDNTGVTGYNVYRGGVKVATTTAVLYSNTGLPPLTQYCYTVSAYDGSGNESGQSTQVCATTNDIRRMKVPDTGQTTSYTTTFGEDADYTINPPSYTNNGDGTVTDNVTGLMWQRQDDGTRKTWADAGAYCDNLTLAGFTDWRLPDMKELTDILDDGKYNPAIDAAVFPGTQSSSDSSYYWSSTTLAFLTEYAWLMHFGNGVSDSYGKNNSSYVRCVRGVAITPSYTGNNDGTVTDNVTGLMWQKQDDGATRNWEAAISYCEALSLGGKNDWRLPNKKELTSIVDYTKSSSAIDTAAFPGTLASYYWSATTTAYDSSDAWYVYFGSGNINRGQGKTGLNYVRCVRDGQ